MSIVEILYTIVTLLLAVYGLNSIYLIWLYHRATPPKQPSPPAEWPQVTVQLPIYNEYHTIERLLRAVSKLDYPRDRLEVQVLDDSTDETSTLVATLASELNKQGLEIVHVQRSNREGYKAGALANGLQQAKGRFIAIFDADFVPPSDFLQQVIPWFGDEQVGCVQTRWDHLNRNYSAITRLQALAIDGHFIIEQTARSYGGLFLNFNGTAGVWRRTCIEDAGGWTADTITEDLDLSYRAQLKGWRIAYLPHVTVPAELPAQMAAYKNQQARWAKGSLQTARKILKTFLFSPQPLKIKIEGILHLTHYFVHPLILGAMFLSLPMSLSNSWLLSRIPLVILASLGPPMLYLLATSPNSTNWPERLKLIPGLILLGIGLSLNNSRAAISGLVQPKGGTFKRTPKFAINRSNDKWEHSSYALPNDPWVWVEVMIGLFAIFSLILSVTRGYWGMVPWMAAYSLSYGFVITTTLVQSTRRRTQVKALSGSSRIPIQPKSTLDRIAPSGD
jgi:cellulose synthase/poly-beta-1,6-N-acetylglucosamine synthase-like glycosyltransferase